MFAPNFGALPNSGGHLSPGRQPVCPPLAEPGPESAIRRERGFGVPGTTERRSFEEKSGARSSRHCRLRPSLRYMRIDASGVRGTRERTMGHAALHAPL